MTVKLNLTVDENTANKIKRYAKMRRTSVSKIAESHFQSIIKAEERKAKDFIEQIAGMIKGFEIGDVKEAITKAIEEKPGDKGLS